MSHPQHPAGSWGLGIFGSLPDSLFLTSLQAGDVVAWVARGFVNGASLAFYRTRGMRGIELSPVPGKSLSSHVQWRLSLSLSLSLISQEHFLPFSVAAPTSRLSLQFRHSPSFLKMLRFLTPPSLSLPPVHLKIIFLSTDVIWSLFFFKRGQQN